MALYWNIRSTRGNCLTSIGMSLTDERVLRDKDHRRDSQRERESIRKTIRKIIKERERERERQLKERSKLSRDQSPHP